MGLRDWWDRVTGRAQIAALAEEVATLRGSSWGAAWMRDVLSSRVSDTVSDPFSQVDTVYIAVSRIERSAASFPWEIVDADDAPAEGPDADYLRRLLRRPQPEVTGHFMFRRTYQHLELAGNAYWLLDAEARDEAGGRRRPQRLRLLRADRVQPRRDSSGELIGWRYTTTTGQVDLALEEVVHAAYPSPWDDVVGMSPLTAARQGYELAYKSGRWQELFFERGGVPPFYVKVPEGVALSDADAQRLRQDFREKYSSGLRSAHSVPLMRRGATLESISVNQRDAEWLAAMRLTREQILAIFDVPPALAGVFEYANYANAKEQKAQFWAGTLPPRLRVLEETINHQLIPRVVGDTELRFVWRIREKLAEVLPESVYEAIDAAAKLIAMGVPPADALAEVGIRYDATDKPWMQIGYLPPSLVPAESLQDLAAARAAPAIEQRADDGRELVRATLWRAYEREMLRLERRYRSAHGRFLRWLEREITASLENRAQPPAERRDMLPPDDDIEKQLLELVEPVIRQTIQTGAEGLANEVQYDLVFDFLDPAVQQIIQARQISIVGATQRLTQRLRASIAEGIAKGETIDELTQRVRDVFRGYRPNAATIARTETASGFNAGRFDAMTKAGVAKHEWLSARDASVRDSHVAEDGNVVEVGQPFPVTSLQHPHDPAGDPGEVINCRCVTVAAEA